MTPARALRFLLALTAVLIIGWSFIDVGARAFQDPRQGRDVMLRVLYWGDQDENRIVHTIIDAFEKDNPRVKVQRIHADFGNFDSKLKTMMAANDPPDLFYLRSDDVAEWASHELVEPLDDHLAASQLPWISDFYPTLLRTFRFDGQNVGQGTLYGLPKDFTTIGMYVNVDLFQQAGVPVPYDGWTWDEFEAAARAISQLPPVGGQKVYGAHFNTWAAMLQAILWSHGADLFATDAQGHPIFTDVTLDEPAAVAAMEMIRRMRFDDRTAFLPDTMGRDGGQEFFTGRIGVIGPEGRWKTPRYRDISGFEFDFVPIPHAAGVQPATSIATVAWTISRQTPHKPEAWQLLQYLTGPEGQAMSAELGLAIPALQSVAESDAFLQPGSRPANTPLFLKLIDDIRVAQWPRQREFASFLEQQVSAAIQQGEQSIEAAAANVERQWLTELQSPLKKDAYPVLQWRPIIIAALVAIAALATIAAWRARREKLGSLDKAQERAGYAFISPWLIGFFVLTLGPMVLSLLLSTARWSAMTPLSEAEFVGMGNFQHLFRWDETFTQSLWVTAYYVVLAIPLGQVAALAVALLMNNALRGIGLFRTIYFLPSVISGVALGTLWLALFNNDYGLINEVLRTPLGWIGLSPPNWFGADARVWAIPAFVLMSLWSVGSAMVIYLAGLKGVPQSLYEASTIDGAGAWHRLINVTLPMISPLIFFNVVMGIIGSFQVFTQAFVMTGGGPGNATLFYVLNLYRQAFEFHNMGYASAMAWVLFVIILGFTLLVFRGSRGLVHYEGLKQ